MSTSELRTPPLVAGAARPAPAGDAGAGLPILAVWVVVLGLCLAFWAGVGVLLATLI